jgi:hypothetical protein
MNILAFNRRIQSSGNPFKGVSIRYFKSITRKVMLEMDANQASNRSNLAKQRSYFKTMMKDGDYRSVIQRFEAAASSNVFGMTEESPIIKDGEILSYYIQALEKEGQGSAILEKLAKLSGASNADVDDGAPITERKDYWIETDTKRFQEATGRTTTRKSGSSKSSAKEEPLHIILSKKWTWSEFASNLGGKVVLGLLVLGGVSYFVDQQGILKNAIGASTEVQPLSMNNPIRFADVCRC